MENFEDKPHLTDEAKQLEQRIQSKIDAGEAQNFSEAQELVMFDEKFGIDKNRDIEDIKKLMKRVGKNPETGRIRNEYSYESDRNSGLLKYSDKQVENCQWEEDDLQLVIEELRKKRTDNYFGNIAGMYEQAMPIADSVVRLDQEAEIAQKLRNNIPVLIRGNWRMGKTSMVHSLVTHQFGATNSLFIDAMGEGPDRDASLDDFRKHFGVSTIAEFIAKREFPSAKSQDKFEKENQIRKQIKESQKLPFEFLNDYLSEKGEKVFLSLDEVMGFEEQPEKLKYLASLKGLSQVQLAIVLHRIASLEDSFKEIFDGYETRFVRQLTVEEIGTLIRKPLEGTSITFTDDAVQKIFEFTGGRPMEVNNVCRALMNQFSENKKYRFTYRAEDIEELAGKETGQLEKSFMIAIHNYRRIYTDSMSNEERVITDRLVREGEIPTSEVSADTIQPLIDTTFVTKDDNKGTYRINGELFRRVVLEEQDH